VLASMSEIRPKLFDDVGVWLFFERGSASEKTYIVGSITADRYLTVPESKLFAVQAFMKLLDGNHGLDEIDRELARESGVRMDVKALHRKFDSAGLLSNGSGPQAGDIERMSTTAIRFPIDGLLRFLHHLSVLSKPMLYAGLALMVLALGFFAFDPASRSAMAKSFTVDWTIIQTLPWFVPIMLLSVFGHELSHCFAAAGWGILTGTLRFQLYLGVIPIAGLKLAGLYTLPSRGRLAVWSAGIFANLSMIAAALVGIAVWSPSSPALHAIVAINWMLAVINLVPLLPTDGYFLLSTLTKDPNVRVRAWHWLRPPFRSARTRPSWFVVTYLVATVWLLVSTFWNNAWRIVHTGPKYPVWQSLLSLCLLMLFTLTLWRVFRRKGELD
jgi:Zn-dependent protease